MNQNTSGKLTPFEEVLVDSVRAIYCKQFPERHADSLHWRKTQKDKYRSTFLFSARGEDHPTYFAKTSSSAATSFKKEFDTLTRLTQNRGVAASIPEVIEFLQEGESCAIVERASAGHLFEPVRVRKFWKKREVSTHMDNVLSWWETLVEAFPGNDKKNLISLQIEYARSAFLERHGSTEVYDSCRDMLARVEAVGAATPVLSLVHGDLWRENIFCRANGICVLDWERTDDVGFPLLDVLLFLSTLIDDSSQSGMIKVFWGRNWLSSVVRERLNRACSFLRLSRSEAEDLFYFFLFTMSSQVMRLFRVRAEWDENWYRRLSCALKNRVSVRMLFSDLHA